MISTSAFVVILAAVSGISGQYNYGSDNRDYGRPSEEHKSQNWAKACERFYCPHPQVCRTTRGVPGCYDDPAASQLTPEHHAPPRVETNYATEHDRQYQSENPDRYPQAYATTEQPHYHHEYPTQQQPLYPNLHPTSRPNYHPAAITTPQPYHRGGYPTPPVYHGGYTPYQQYYPGYPYQQNYGNLYPSQQGGYPGSYGVYGPTQMYPPRQPEYFGASG